MLYIIGTPIGNLGEMSTRAIDTLKSVDYIACEDTRTSLTLLKHFEIEKPLVSYHKFNEKSMLSKLVNDLKSGKNIGLISDAGMPVISDPGNILINEIKKHDIEYTVISGPSAFVNAFILSGYDYPFTFIGFLPNKNGEIKKMLELYKNAPTTLIIYLAPHDLEKTFKILLDNLGDREVCVTRELTKKFESVEFTTLSRGYQGVEKGEFVLVVKGADQTDNYGNLTIKQHYEQYISNGLTKNDAIKQVAHDRKLKKDVVYKEINEIE